MGNTTAHATLKNGTKPTKKVADSEADDQNDDEDSHQVENDAQLLVGRVNVLLLGPEGDQVGGQVAGSVAAVERGRHVNVGIGLDVEEASPEPFAAAVTSGNV